MITNVFEFYPYTYNCPGETYVTDSSLIAALIYFLCEYILEQLTMKYRFANTNDIEALKTLAVNAWEKFADELTTENWARLKSNLQSNKTYEDLLEKGLGFVCVNDEDKIVGMSFLVPSGQATELYDENWCSVRFVSVDPYYNGLGIGKTLTQKCIEAAKINNEKIIALHTSEMMNAARHIYESLGFTILKEIEPRLGKRYWIYLLKI